MSETKEIAVQEKQAASLTVGKTFSLTPTSITEAMSLAKMIADSDLAPKDFKGKAGNCLIAMQMGMEVGLSPMQAIQNIAVINGRPTIWGDASLALVQANPVCEYVIEEWDEKTQTWTCRGKRKDRADEVSRTFSMADAKTAKLANKEGPWTNYPKRMIQMRARAFMLRDCFTDVLKGLAIREEVMDYVNTSEVKPDTIQTPKAKAPDTEPAGPKPAANIDPKAVITEEQQNFLLRKLTEMGADMDEVLKFIKAKFGKDATKDLTVEEAGTVIKIWQGDPEVAA
jgi:hypothetical protein